MRIQSYFTLTAFWMMLCLSQLSLAANREEIDHDVAKVLKDFNYLNAGNAALIEKAEGVLVFPSVIKAGFVVGGEYGEGALMVKGKTAGYYSVASASVGLQAGAQERAELILFMEPHEFEKFKNADGWSVGVDGSVAVVEAGAGKGLSTETVKNPVIAVVMVGRGLMANVSLEGSKISKIDR